MRSADRAERAPLRLGEDAGQQPAAVFAEARAVARVFRQPYPGSQSLDQNDTLDRTQGPISS